MVLVMKHVFKNSHLYHTHTLYTICLLAFIFTLHASLPVYINSSFLGTFLSDEKVGLLYTISSIVTIIGFLSISRILRKIGNYKTAVFFCTIQLFALLGLVAFKSMWFVALSFIVSNLLVNLISFNIDVFLQANSENAHTGEVRGLFLTVINTAWILAPMITGSLLTNGDYWKIYLSSVILMIPVLLILTKNFRGFKDPHYEKTPLVPTLAQIWKTKDYFKIFAANVFLNIFYAWMVIYTPLYLHEHVGFSWSSIGLIFTVMLLPFIIFELPLGKAADSRWGEKEFMTIGFVVMAISTGLLSFIAGQEVWLWALALFMTRIGASITEIMIETYFFKKVDGNHSNVLGLFRTTRQFPYIVVPLIFGVSLMFLHFQYTFLILACFMILAMYFSLTIKDTN
jgi:MFS family permease